MPEVGTKAGGLGPGTWGRVARASGGHLPPSADPRGCARGWLGQRAGRGRRSPLGSRAQLHCIPGSAEGRSGHRRSWRSGRTGETLAEAQNRNVDVRESHPDQGLAQLGAHPRPQPRNIHAAPRGPRRWPSRGGRRKQGHCAYGGPRATWTLSCGCCNERPQTSWPTTTDTFSPGGVVVGNPARI